MSKLNSMALLFLILGLVACGSSNPRDLQLGSGPGGKGDVSVLQTWRGDDRPYADMFNSTSVRTKLEVRGRLVEEDEDDINDPEVKPTHLLSEHEIKEQAVEVVIYDGNIFHKAGDLRTSEEGYLDRVLDISTLKLEPGLYEAKVLMEGKIAGSFTVTLLATDRTAPVVRSDVDLTYLDTDFQSASSILGLLREDASEKVALPGMPLVYQELRNSQGFPVTFLSGSPKFFKRTLENKMKLDGVGQDGLVLKPLKDGVSSNILDLEFNDILPEAKEQIGYKLFWLLRMRAQLPAQTPEILLGDDSEADHVIYNIYFRYLNEELSLSELRTLLDELGVSPTWSEGVLKHASALNPSESAAPVGIYINQTKVLGDHYPIAEWMIPGLTLHHAGALPLIEALGAKGWASEAAVAEVSQALN